MSPMSESRWRGLVVGLLILSGLSGDRAVAGGKQFRPGLESYLKRHGYESIPLRHDEQNHWLVGGLVNGKKRDFLVDTGCSVTRISKSAGAKLPSVAERGVKLEDTVLGSVENSAMVIMDRLKLGEAEFLNQPAMLGRLASTDGNIEDGILGCDFFYRNFCLLDCLDGRLYVRSEKPSSELQAALEESFRRIGLLEVPLQLHPELVMTCPARINGQEIVLLVDSGAIWSVLDNDQARKLGLSVDKTPASIDGPGNKSIVQWLDRTRLKAVKLGDVSVGDLDFGVSQLDGWGIAVPGRSGLQIHGMLGGEFLTLHAAVVDCGARKLWLQIKVSPNPAKAPGSVNSGSSTNR